MGQAADGTVTAGGHTPCETLGDAVLLALAAIERAAADRVAADRAHARAMMTNADPIALAMRSPGLLDTASMVHFLYDISTGVLSVSPLAR